MLRAKGILMIVVGAMFWGATGPMMEWILDQGMSKQFLLILRLLVAGAGLLAVLKWRGIPIRRPFAQPFWTRKLIIFGIFGMLGVQYTFLASIDTSNAVIATLFQFLAPIYIILFVSLIQKAVPPIAQILGMLVTLIGLFLLLTDGTLEGFALSREAVFWGIAVGFAFSFYTLYPGRLMHEWGVLLVVGWGMVIGGVILFIFNPITFMKGIPTLFDWQVALMLLGVIIIGTIAFVLFLGSMTYITPVETSVLSSFEPLTAMVISILWFGIRLGTFQLIGGVTMLVGVTAISLIGNKVKTPEVEPKIE